MNLGGGFIGSMFLSE